METLRPPLVEWGVVSAAIEGQPECGDQIVAEVLPDGFFLAAIDGLGHGRDAARAASVAAQVLSRHANETLLSVLWRCHEALNATRGVVLSMASFKANEGTMSWLGIGNVAGLLVRADPAARPRSESLSLRRGVVGGEFERPCVWMTPVACGDTLVLSTDGVRSDFSLESFSASPPQQIADRLFALHCKGTDDALVAVARYNGVLQTASAVHRLTAGPAVPRTMA